MFHLNLTDELSNQYFVKDTIKFTGFHQINNLIRESDASTFVILCNRHTYVWLLIECVRLLNDIALIHTRPGHNMLLFFFKQRDPIHRSIILADHLMLMIQLMSTIITLTITLRMRLNLMMLKTVSFFISFRGYKIKSSLVHPILRTYIGLTLQFVLFQIVAFVQTIPFLKSKPTRFLSFLVDMYIFI